MRPPRGANRAPAFFFAKQRPISYGAEIGFDVTPRFQVTAEWDRTQFNFVNGDQDLDMYSLGVRYKF